MITSTFIIMFGLFASFYAIASVISFFYIIARWGKPFGWQVVIQSLIAAGYYPALMLISIIKDFFKR
jgi:hypothetical protein